MTERRPTFDAAELIKTHQDGVWRYLRALGCEAALADDVTQETFLWALEHPFQDYNPAATAAYLRKVARSMFINVQRRRGLEVPAEDLDSVDLAWTRWAEADGGDELLDALKGCLQGVTDKARLALEMRFRDKASRAEIAAAVKLTEDGAKNLMQRAKAALRACIERKLG